MATSSAMSTTNDKIKYKISIVENSQSVSGNYTNVTVSVRVYRTNTGYTTYGTGTVYCKINGTTYSESITSDDKITSSGIVLFKKSLNITHDSDGSKRLTTSARITHDQFSSSEQSYSVDLTTIPRATTPTVSASSADMGTSVTISMPRASSSFTHTLKYAFGDTSGTIGSSLGTSKAWTIPLSLANEIPNATSGTVTITCDTYNGSTKIGSKTVKVTAKVPSDIKPSISSISVSDTETDIATKFGAYIKGYSELKVTVNASGSYSSTITKYSTKFMEVTYSTKSFTVSNLTDSGSFSFSATVTDSRGRTATLTKSVSILDYALPNISNFTVTRSNADGTFNPEGAYAKLDYAFTISALNNLNDKSYVIRYRKNGESNYTDLVEGGAYSINTSLVPTITFDVNSTYDIQLRVSDYFKTITYTGQLSTAFTLMDFHSSGKGIGFGKVAEEEELADFGIEARFRKGLKIDSEWIDLTLNEELFALYNSSSQPRYKVAGGYVSVIGAVTPVANIDSSADTLLVASGIPSGLRPPITLNFVCQGSGMNKWLCQITSSGTITLSRYGVSEFSQILPGNWLPFAVGYAI